MDSAMDTGEAAMDIDGACESTVEAAASFPQVKGWLDTEPLI